MLCKPNTKVPLLTAGSKTYVILAADRNDSLTASAQLLVIVMSHVIAIFLHQIPKLSYVFFWKQAVELFKRFLVRIEKMLSGAIYRKFSKKLRCDSEKQS